MMGPLPGPRRPLDRLLPSSFASLLASLSVTLAAGAWSLEISFSWNCPFPPWKPEEIPPPGMESVRGALCPRS